jgi:hypothetical protein
MCSRKTYITSVLVIVTILLLISFRHLAWDEYEIGFPIPSLLADSPAANPDLLSVSSRKAAAIVETRPLDSLIPIVLHFSSVLGPEWPIHIFTSPANIGIFSDSIPFQRQVEAGQFHVRALPTDIVLNTHASISGFFTKPWFWEAMAPAEQILLFQADSMLCSNSPQSVDDFLQYDFVGAPINGERGLGIGYNGGLSIRNRSLCLDIVNTYDWQDERHGDHAQGNVDYEDQWFAKKMRELPRRDDGTPGANLPQTDVAMRFAVETMWFDRPLGFHQVNVWQPGKMEEIYKWCPEYKLCTVETFTDHNLDA